MSLGRFAHTVAMSAAWITSGVALADSRDVCSAAGVSSVIVVGVGAGGGVAMGVVACGVVAIGVVAMGVVAGGVVAGGVVAIGVVAGGVVAMGVVAGSASTRSQVPVWGWNTSMNSRLWDAASRQTLKKLRMFILGTSTGGIPCNANPTSRPCFQSTFGS